MARENTQALCMMCGVGHGHHYDDKQRVEYLRVGTPHNYWERMVEVYDLDKAFGVYFPPGKGGFKDFEYFDVNDPRAEPYKGPMSKLVLLTVRRALRLRLVRSEDILEAIAEEEAQAG